MPIHFDRRDPAFLADPYPIYAALRDEDPVHALVEPEGVRFWLVTRHADALAVLRDPRCSALKFPEPMLAGAMAGSDPAMSALARAVSGMMLVKDAPDHTRLRGLVSKAFTPRVVERLRERIEAIADALLDAVRDAGEMELLRDFAAPLPVIVIAELLGVPVADRERFKRWSDDLVLFADGALRERGLGSAARAALELTEYLADFIERRRKDPRDDLMSGLVAAHERGDALAQHELIGTAILLLAAGHETTTNLIGNGLLALLRHPEQWQRLRREPGLAASAVEELLRFDSPVQLTSRLPREAIEVDGHRIEAGEEINVMIGAANRDPAVFADPDRLDLGRGDNRHLAFGHGAHFCLGAPLARLEARIAFERLARGFPRLALASDALAWRPGLVLRGLCALPVRWS